MSIRTLGCVDIRQRQGDLVRDITAKFTPKQRELLVCLALGLEKGVDREALGVGAAGLILLGLSAEPGPAQALPPGWRWILLGMAVPVAAIAFYAKRHNRFWAAPALGFGAGLGFSVVGISARTLEIPDSAWRLILEPSVWAIVLNGLIAAVVFAMALQKGGPTAVTAIMFTTNTVLSSLVGLSYLDDRVRAGFVAPAATGFVLAIAAAIAIAHYAAKARQTGASTTPEHDRV